MVKAVPSGYADVDGDQLTYRYQWLRNGDGHQRRDLRHARPLAGRQRRPGRPRRRGRDRRRLGRRHEPGRARRPDDHRHQRHPVEGTASIAPTSPKTNEAPHRHAQRLPRAGRRRAHLPGTGGCATAPSISGATAATLDLSQAGNGDRGDAIRVEVSAADPGGRLSDPAAATVTVANTAPTAGTASVKPTAPSTDDIVSAVPSGFADADGDAVSYQYQWFRNGTAISGATGRTLNLADPGNGDAGDMVAVDVTALDGNGGTSSDRARQPDRRRRRGARGRLVRLRGGRGIGVVDESGGNDGTLGGATRANSGRFGRALSFDGEDDIVTVPDDDALRLSGAMTLEAWVQAARPPPTGAASSSRSPRGGVAYGAVREQRRRHAEREPRVATRALAAPPTSTRTSGRTSPPRTTARRCKLFVNGAPGRHADAAGRARPTAAGPLTFGANNVWGERFRGLIDEVRIYNRALTPAEIASDMGAAGRGRHAGSRPPTRAPDVIGSFAAPKAWPIVPGAPRAAPRTVRWRRGTASRRP